MTYTKGNTGLPDGCSPDDLPGEDGFSRWCDNRDMGELAIEFLMDRASIDVTPDKNPDDMNNLELIEFNIKEILVDAVVNEEIFKDEFDQFLRATYEG